MQVTIEKLVYGGSGLARTSEGVVFVPRTAPGDVVEVELVERKKDYAVGRLVRILEPSADRQTPVCPNYELAGCCHWQHIAAHRQVDIKEDILRETLRRTGRIESPATIDRISGPDRGYRLRASFHVREGRLGFVRENSHMVVPILECSALSDELNAFIPEANGLLASPAMAEVIEVRAVSGPPVAATFATDRATIHRHPAGEDLPRIDVNGFAFELHPDAFLQSNRFLLGRLLDEALLRSGPAPKHVLDLYCGAGFFAVPLARRSMEVLGVDANKLAIKQAERNARMNAVKNVRFFAGDVAGAIKDADIHPDLVLVDPPRAGCGKETAKRIAALRAARVVYVSCNPTTFAMEASYFLGGGYTLDHLTLVDQFPDTYHIELVAQFGLK